MTRTVPIRSAFTSARRSSKVSRHPRPSRILPTEPRALPPAAPATLRPLEPALHNLSPGPGALPREVLERAQAELLSWPHAPGTSVMCISHRETDGPYQQLQKRVADQVRAALDVPDNYHVLFMHGGAHGQFSAVPLNLVPCDAREESARDAGARRAACAAVDTGFWARKAAAEHEKLCDVQWAASAAPGGELDCSSAWWATRGGGFTTVPAASTWRVRDDASFVHICANETIHGLEFFEDPDLEQASFFNPRAATPPLDARAPAAPAARRRRPMPPPLVADFTSTLLSRPVDVSRYGVLYCSGGKNLGPAGVTLVLVRDDLLADDPDARTHAEHPFCPGVLSYRSVARSAPAPSLATTPPTFAVYMVGLVLEHLAARGGVRAAERRAVARAAKVYDAIDASGGFFENRVEHASRSRMSVPFRVRGPAGAAPHAQAALERAFLDGAEAAGFRYLGGHPLFGGARATLYDGVPDESVDALVAFMKRFHARHA